ncbi:uncharacterized protein LOC125814820 [Solanum verrucosum]|uniref:uncharacterized protein LOC125814820 n=1 Tax=Solanum verrucosum TaxID=315347 RepID=UPI0020D06967|nr:uncharacterized protein LOC125814820 [Solanum verrucosum]
MVNLINNKMHGPWQIKDIIDPESGQSAGQLESCLRQKVSELQSTPPIRSDERRLVKSSSKSPGRPGRSFTPLSKEVSTKWYQSLTFQLVNTKKRKDPEGMAAPLNMEEGQSSTGPPRFNGQYYGWWNNRMHDYINADDSELWDIILNGPYIPTKEMKDEELTTTVVKTRKDYNEADRKKIEKNYKAKKILVCGIGADEYNRISACETAKEIWDCLQTAHEGTQRVKESKVDMLTTQYEKFIMKEGETIFEMNSRFTSITNELRGLGEPIPVYKQIRKILKVLPKSWESKVDAITKAKDLMTLPMDELIGNLQTYEMNKKQGITVKEGKKEKSIALKISQSEETHNTRPRKRDLVPDHAQRKAPADQLVRKAFAVWGNDSSESEEYVECHEDVSMMAIEDDESISNSIFSLMANSDDKEDLDEVTLFYLKDDLDNLPIENLRKLAALLIDCVDERTTENLMLNKKLSFCEAKNSALMSQVAEISERIGTLETSNITPEKNPGNSVGGKRKL